MPVKKTYAASSDELEKKLAHPDTGGSAEKFRELRENYRKAMEIMGGNDNAAKE